MLSRERTIAPPNFNRWLVPPAALAVHLSIGMAYGFSVFWLPLSRAIGITQSVPGDWSVLTLGTMYTLFFVFLGSSAALFGPWVEREGPRKTGFVAACCWSGGFFISALGIHLHQIWLLWLGSGVIGGCGLGLGYISPVSTLIKWFPDRRGMATGMAIMGFGGGAMIGSPLAAMLMQRFATPTSVGVKETFLVMGALYFVSMMVGAFGYRLPPPGWKPAGWTPPADVKAATDSGSVPVSVAWKTKQFWLMWGVLCLNVSAGIGVLGIASPMIQEMFKGRVTAVEAAGFVGLLSLFNIGGRFFWASLSDKIGRPMTYNIFFVLGMALYGLAPTAGATGSLALFVLIFGVILTMYGGGFATVPAYLADRFGVANVGAIHGRLLTAWSTAGILGPFLVNGMRDAHLPYSTTLYILVGFLALGLVCNLLIRPVPVALFTLKTDPKSAAPAATHATLSAGPVGNWGLVAIAWIAVGLPLGWGLYRTVVSAAKLFQ